MSLFDQFIVQPIFNVLAFIYGVIPGSDFGISLIILTVLVRVLMWPLVKKQLHQTKLMRALQPELKTIKSRAGGDKQKEAQLMMELYRERGVKPFSSIGLLLIQLPIFIALYRVIQIITVERDKIAHFTYQPIEQLQPIANIINSTNHHFNESLLNIVNLSKIAVTNTGIYWPVVVLAVLAAVFQYIQSRQITPQPAEKKRLRDLFSDAAKGKDVDQGEVSTIMTNNMIILFPFLTLMIGLYLPGALVLYFAVSSIVAVIQQHILLNRDVEEMEVIASDGTKATIIPPAQTSQKNSADKKKKRSLLEPKPAKTSGETTVRIITATESKVAANSFTTPIAHAKKKRKKRRR